tara:strand:- start:1006 stop:1209 length:204 start_codon:yes stop_codon:yes gene_type:complete
MFPLVIMYKDPQESWDKIVEERILEEIRKEGFDKFTVIDEEAGKTFLEFKVKKNVKPDKKKKVRKKK